MLKKAISVILVCASLLFVVFHQAALSLASGWLIKLYTYRSIGEALSYEDVTLNGHTLLITRPSLRKHHFSADQITVDYELDWQKREIHLNVQAQHPVWQIEDIEKTEKVWKSFLKYRRPAWFKVNSIWKVQEGFLKWYVHDHEERSLSFDLEFDNVLGGFLKANFDKNQATDNQFRVQLTSQPDGMRLQWDCSHLSCDSWIRLLALIYPELERYHIDSGSVEGQLSAMFPSDERPYLEGELLVEHLSFRQPDAKLQGNIKKSQIKMLKNPLQEDGTGWKLSTIGWWEILDHAQIMSIAEDGSYWSLNDITGRIQLDESKKALLTFQGDCNHQNYHSHIKLKGQANLNSRQSFNVDLKLDCSSIEQPDSHIDFVIYQPKGSLKIAEVRCKQLSYLEWNFLKTCLADYWPSLKQINFHEGCLNALAYVEFTKHGFENVHCPHFQIDRLKCEVMPWRMNLQFPKWEGQLSFNLNKQDIWGSLNADIYTTNGQIHWKKLHAYPIQEIHTKLLIRNGDIHQSAVKLEFAGLKGIMDVMWKQDKKLMTLNLEGKPEEIINLFPSSVRESARKRFQNQELGVIANIKEVENQLQIEGSLHIQRAIDSQQKDLIHFGYTFQKDSKHKESQTSLPGWFHAKSLPLEKFVSPFIFRRDNALLSGLGEFLGSFDHEKIIIKYQPQDLKIENEDLLIQINETRLPAMEQLSGHHVFYLNSGVHEGVLPVSDASYLEKNTIVSFSDIQTNVYFKGETICLKNLEGVCEGIYLSGQVDLDYSDPAPGVFTVDASLPIVNGKVSYTQQLLSHFGQSHMLSKVPLEGDIEAKGKGLKLKFDFVPKDYTLHASFQGALVNGAMDISKANMAFRDLGMDIEYEHQNQTIAFNDLQGSLLIGKPQQAEEYFITGHYLRFLGPDQQDIQADVEIKGKGRPFFRVVGKGSKTDEGVNVQLDRTLSHVCCIYPHAFEMHLKDWSDLSLLSIEAPFKLDAVWGDIRSVLVQTGMFLPDRLLEKVKLIRQMQGNMNVNLHYEGSNDVLTYQVKGNEVGWNDSLYKIISLKGTKRADQWNIDQLMMDDLAIAANVSHQGNDWNFDFLSINRGSSFLLGFQGKFLENIGNFNGQINVLEVNLSDMGSYPMFQEIYEEWPLHGFIKGKGKINLTFSDEQENGYIMDAYLQAHVDQCKISGLPICLEKPIEISVKPDGRLELLNLDTNLLIKDQKQAHIVVNRLSYHPKQEQMDCSDVSFNIPSHYLENVGNTLHQCFPEVIDEPLRDLLKDLKSEGSLSGNLNVKKSANTYALEIALADGNYNFRQKTYPLRSFRLDVTPQELKFKGFSFHERCPFSFEGQSNFPQADQGVLILTDAFQQIPETKHLFIKWKSYAEKGLIIESMQGSFCGLDLDLHPIDVANPPWSALQGMIRVDLNALCPLLSKEVSDNIQNLELGPHHVLKGCYQMNPELGEDLLDTVYFEGELLSADTILKGYFIEEIKSDVKYVPGRLEARDLSISDPGILVHCPEMNVIKDQNTKSWYFFVPHLVIKNLRPGTLRDLQDPSTSKYKTLLIKKAELHDWQGQLDEVDTWEGYGSFHFQNPSRKNLNHPLLAIPAEIILRLGLDSNVLSPVTGTVYFTLQGNRLYFNRFKDVYSEGRGSKFYLANTSQPSWMDLEGNLSVQIRMKQYNLIFKLAELFTVSIQGNIKKPKYSLQRHDKN